jgi:uncharacterized protein
VSTNVALVRSMTAAYARGDWQVAAESLHPDIEWDFSAADWPDQEVSRGRDEVLRFFRRFLGVWEDYEVQFEEFIPAGDDVVVFVRESGVGRGSGVRVEHAWTQLWTVRDGRMVRFRAFSDRSEALAAAGLGAP